MDGAGDPASLHLHPRRAERRGLELIFRDVTETVGHTPLVELARIGAGLPARVVGKLEMRNPLGSVKNRVAVALAHTSLQPFKAAWTDNTG
jgi:threonine dehydratase